MRFFLRGYTCVVSPQHVVHPSKNLIISMKAKLRKNELIELLELAPDTRVY